MKRQRLLCMFFAVAVLLFCYCELSYAATTNINVGSGVASNAIQTGYNNAANGETIQLQAGTYVENDLFNVGTSVALMGGYNSSFSTNSSNSAIAGTLKISSGTVTIGNIIIQSPAATACATAAFSVTVTGSTTGNPLQGALVTAGTQAATTGATGIASFTGLSAIQNQTTPITISVSAAGYNTQATTAVLSCGTTTAENISLSPLSPTLMSIAVTPANPSIAVGNSEYFTATGTYSDGSTQNLTSSVTWSSSDTSVATNGSNGIVTPVAAGSAIVTAVSGNTWGNTALTVTIINSHYQGSTTNGTVSGVVVDKRGVPIPGVTITALHTNVSIGVTTTTDANGAYSFTTLNAGDWSDYQISPEKAGFGFYPSYSGSAGGIVKAGFLTVIQFPLIPQGIPLTGVNFTAYRPGDKVVSVPRTGQTTSYVGGDDSSANAGVTWPRTRFTDNNDGTVTDGLTGLVWIKNAGCFAPGNWQVALDYANKLASGSCGLTDGSTPGQWRMPNINELESLVDISQSNPAISNGNPFTNINFVNAYWSSTTYMGLIQSPYDNYPAVASDSPAMVIRFTDGKWINGTDGSFSNYKTLSNNSLWAVKSGSAGVVNLQATGEYYVWATGDDSYHTCPFCEDMVNSYYIQPDGRIDPGGAVDTPVAGDSASLVNARPLTSPRLIDNGDGTLSDTVTGLRWLKNANCIQASWEDAITAVNNLASGQCGLTDGSTAGQWRMPNRFEMLSLADRSVQFSIAEYYNGIYGADLVTVDGPVVFTTFEDSQFYWTSSTYVPDNTQAWTVFSCDFGVYNIPKSSMGYTMAVR